MTFSLETISTIEMHKKWLYYKNELEMIFITKSNKNNKIRTLGCSSEFLVK